MARKLRRDRSEVSLAIKYLVFGFNVLFWLLGGLLCGVGIWAWTEKNMFDNIGKITKIPVDPALVFIIVGLVIFIIGFAGCVGALRENTCLLLFYCGSIGVIFFTQLILGILGFVYKDWVKDQIKRELHRYIEFYREDQDIQNLIDWVQKDWLGCCGVDDYNDWDKNLYFNCSSPSAEKCGVPFSCCKTNTEVLIRNHQCGFDMRRPSVPVTEREKMINTIGCIKAGENWLQKNLIPVAAVAVGIALIQILGICCAQNLRSDIFAQKSKWSS